MRRLLTGVCVGTMSAALIIGPAWAGNPSGSGQPSQSCQAEPTGPPGITSTSNGFGARG